MDMFWKRKKNKTKHYFVSIGAGLNQLPLITEAKKSGFNTIAVDQDISAPGFKIADIRIQESIYSFEEIERHLTGLMLIDGEIKGVLARSFGNAIKTAAYLNSKLKIPHIPFERTDDFINKLIMKNVFSTNGIKTPRLINFNSKKADDHDIKVTPLIVKPVTGHAKDGVKTIISKKELKAEIKKPKYKSGEILIEEMVTGDEIIAAGIVAGGTYYLIEITDKITGPLSSFFDRIHSSPSKYIDYSGEIKKTGQKVAEAFGIITSPLIMEFIISSTKEIFLIEAVPEFGGEYIADLLIPGKSRYNFFRQAVKSICRMDFKPPPSLKTRPGFVIRYIPGREGRLVSCNTEKASRISGITAINLLKKTGSLLQNPVTNHDRIAVITAKASTLEKALKTAEQAEEAMEIRIDNERME